MSFSGGFLIDKKPNSQGVTMAVRGKDLVTWGLLLWIGYELSNREAQPAEGAAVAPNAGAGGACGCAPCEINTRWGSSAALAGIPSWIGRREATMQPFIMGK